MKALLDLIHLCSPQEDLGGDGSKCTEWVIRDALQQPTAPYQETTSPFDLWLFKYIEAFLWLP